MKTGSTVRLIQPEIKGQVKERRINPRNDELELLVEFDDGGTLTQRWFDADLLQLVESTETPKEGA